MEDLLSATIYDLCCSKALLPWTIFELAIGDDRMSLSEFYRHISTCRNVYCKLCGCSTSLNYLLKCKFSATNNNNNRPPACMGKPFPGRETGNLFGVASARHAYGGVYFIYYSWSSTPELRITFSVFSSWKVHYQNFNWTNNNHFGLQRRRTKVFLKTHSL